jgi:leucyl-tRNA synthetase
MPGYNPEAIEPKWQRYWDEHKTFRTPDESDNPKLYILDMFPYPSGAGLHVGHPEGYTATDILARYRRMRGDNVLHPMGWDAFGLPAEQYAIETGTHPRVTTQKNIETFRRQIKRLGFSYDWDREVDTTDPNYFKWTQWIFLIIYDTWYDPEQKKGRPISELPIPPDVKKQGDAAVRAYRDSKRLAYQIEAPVNWCPALGTVLANEEVVDGKSERGGHPVVRMPLRQWMLRITAYAERLLEGLEQVDWSEGIKELQRNWIGRSEGAEVDFYHDISTTPKKTAPIRVFTTRPDTLFGATYMVLSPEHPLVDRITTRGQRSAVKKYQEQAARKSDLERTELAKKKTGVFTGAYAINPVNYQTIPIWIADYVLASYGTGAIMAVPGQDERDWEFAEVYNLPIIRTVQPPEGWEGKAYLGEGPAINSSFLNGLGIADAKRKIIDWLEQEGVGVRKVNYKLRDWLFSRQRYWGEPFPIVYDETDLPIALPESMLPVELPDTDDFSPKSFPPEDADSSPEPPLGRLTDWVTVELDLGDGPKRYRRETNTMPNWAGSCWYEVRYLDPTNTERFVDPSIEHYWMGPSADRPLGGVELYVGGVEHAVLHLLYARFWHKVLFDLGYLTSSEPFHRLVNQGMLQLPAYTNRDGFYVEAAEVDERDGRFYFDGEEVTQEFGKIGKSLKNVVTPDDFIAEFGADTFRLFEMFSGPLEQSRPWDAKAIVGPYRLLQRIWRVVVDEETGAVHVSDDEVPDELNRLLHKAIHAVRDGYETLRFNTSIARITELNNAITQAYPHGGAPHALAEPLVLLLAPLAPHAAEELWARLGHDTSLAWTEFPVADPALLVDDTIEVPVQVNGKVRAVLSLPADSDAAAMEQAARADARVATALDGRETKRVVAVPGRLVNFVV